MNNKISLQPTGIPAFDEILHGGIPVGSTVLLAGAAGSGKTILSLQWLFEGAKTQKEPGIYISLTESIEKTLRNAETMEFFNKEYINPLQLHFTDLRQIIKGLKLDDKSELQMDDLNKIIDIIYTMAEQMKAKRIVIDSITAFLYKIKNIDLIRSFIFTLGTRLEQIDATVFLLSEVSKAGYSVFGVEEFISDGIIFLSDLTGEQSLIRKLTVVKMRGNSFASGPVSYEITDSGINIYPKIPITSLTAKTNYSNRVKSGIEGLDDLIDGGYPEGHVILVGGNTGTGKSTIGMRFLWQGISQGEHGVYICLEESIEQVKKTALAHGLDFSQVQKDGLLTLIEINVIDIYPDRTLYNIINIINSMNAKRIVIDSVSSLETATLNKNSVREFLLQLKEFLKSKGTTSLMTYLTASMFGATNGQLLGSDESSDLRLSSIVDGIILLRYVERDQEVRKLMNVLKMRGSSHDKSIREYTIDFNGIHIGDKYKN